MAFASDSTTAPARPLLPFVFRHTSPVDDPGSAVNILGEVRRTIEGQEVFRMARQTSVLAPEALLAAGGLLKSEEWASSDVHGSKLSREGDAVYAPDLGDGTSTSAARAIHLRRQLEAAAERGADLLAALGLPPLVGPDFTCHDIVTAGDALGLAIDTLDALDGDTDLEDDEREDEGDAEPSLGAPERHPSSTFALSDPYYEPGIGRHRVLKGYASQASWAQGSLQDGQGEAEAGYDLPEGDDERDGSDLDDREPEDCGEPYLSVVEFDGGGDNWKRSGSGTSAWGTDVEDVMEGDGQYDPVWYERPIGPAPQYEMPSSYRREARALVQQAERVQRRTGTARPGAPAWGGPTLTRSGIEVVGLVGL